MTIFDIFYWLGVSLLLFVIYKLVVQPLTFLAKMKLKYGDKVVCYYYPILGEANLLVKGMKIGKPFQFIHEMQRKNPKAKMLIGYGLHCEVYIFDIDIQKEVLLTQYTKFGKARRLFMINQTISKGMIFSDGAFWKGQRQVLSNAFHFDALRNRIPYMIQVASDIVAEMKQTIKEGDSVSMINWCERITGEIIVRTFFGKNFSNKQVNGKNISLELANVFLALGDHSFSLEKIVKSNFVTLHYWNNELFWSAKERDLIKRARAIVQTVTEIIEQRMAQYESGEISPQATDNSNKMFLDIILDSYFLQKERHPEDKKNIVHQFMTFFFAGMDTTGVTTGQSLYQMCLHPDIMERAKKELAEVIPNQGRSPELITSEHLAKLEYISAIYKETLRLYSPVSLLVPRTVLDDCVLGGFFELKKNQDISIIINTNLQSFSEQYFKDAQSFVVDRWFTDEPKNIPAYAYIPFSAGPRNCLGQHMAQLEIKVMIAFMLAHFDISLTDDNFKMKQAILYQPLNDKLFHLKPRPQ